jgi:hypothetical protein
MHPVGHLLALAREELQVFVVANRCLARVNGLTKRKAQTVEYSPCGSHLAIGHLATLTVCAAYSMQVLYTLSVPGLLSLAYSAGHLWART